MSSSKGALFGKTGAPMLFDAETVGLVAVTDYGRGNELLKRPYETTGSGIS